MNKDGPIIIIEDDPDDQELLKTVFRKLNYKNELIFFIDGDVALEFLNQPTIVPFIILSDINLPKLDGFELRKKLKTDADLAIKCIPYLFLTTALNQKAVMEAYSMSAQGFFVKGNSLPDLEETITVIMEYWKKCVAPHNFQTPTRDKSTH
jgi:CheY-like chemotaxis protein